MALTCAEPTDFLHVSLDLQDLINVEERGRVRFSLVQAGNPMEDYWVFWIWEYGCPDECIDTPVTTRLKVVVVETIIWVLQYRGVRTEILQ